MAKPSGWRGHSGKGKGRASLKARLTWRPSDATQVDLFLQHERFKDQTDPFIPLSQLQSDPFTVAYNDPGEEEIEQDLLALRARHDFGAFDLLSVTAYRRSA